MLILNPRHKRWLRSVASAFKPKATPPARPPVYQHTSYGVCLTCGRYVAITSPVFPEDRRSDYVPLDRSPLLTEIPHAP
jgi:hypothetical protein